MKSGGRPSKLTPAAKKKIVAAVRDGTPLKYAARSAGVCARTLRRWMKAGREKSDTDCVSLLSAVTKAEAAGIAELVRGIKKAGQKQWQALAWILERRHPEHFASGRGELKELAKLLKEQSEELATLKARLGNTQPDAPEGTAEPGGDAPPE